MHAALALVPNSSALEVIAFIYFVEKVFGMMETTSQHNW